MSEHAATSSSNDEVVPQEALLEILSFAVALPNTILQGFDEPAVPQSVGLGEHGIVGTIVVLKKSVMVWFGWGQLQTSTSCRQDTTPAMDRLVGQASNLSMGPLIVAMPRSNFHGAFSGDGEASTSKLIGSDRAEDETIGRQMSSRLSKRLGIAVFVSCSFEGAPDLASQGVDQDMIQHRAAALAEKEIGRLLQAKQL